MQKGFFQRQALRALQQDKYALLLATLLAAVPLIDWLALVVMSLVTLRHGARAGLQVLLPVMLMHVLISVVSTSVSSAVVMSCLSILPCYCVAYVLKATSSWRFVAAVLFGFVMVGTIMLQAFSPDLIMQQYVQLESAVQSLGSSKISILDMLGQHQVSSLVLANYLLGFQAASLAFSAIFPLFFARSLQSQLFYPGGFRKEMLSFRGDRTVCLILILLLSAAYLEYVLAINCLPLLLLYFVLAGLSFAAYVLSNMRPLVLMLVLLLPVMFLSWVFLSIYTLIGAFDGLFNFRLYLSTKTGKQRNLK